MSQARSALEQANVALEDLLIAELSGTTGQIDRILHPLMRSKNHLRQMAADAKHLRLQMRYERFEDLPTLKTADLKAIGEDLAKQGMVDPSAWQRFAPVMFSHGFRGVIDGIILDIETLRTYTEHLHDRISGLRVHAAQGTINQVVEGNLGGNFKRDFAVLYRSWNLFQQLFLASSLLSTELWYRHTNAGTLCNSTQVEVAAA